MASGVVHLTEERRSGQDGATEGSLYQSLDSKDSKAACSRIGEYKPWERQSLAC